MVGSLLIICSSRRHGHIDTNAEISISAMLISGLDTPEIS